MTVQNFVLEGDVDACPCCGEDSCTLLSIHDPMYARSNNVSKSGKVEISEDGEFEIMACEECGYKYVLNDGVATSSQLKNLVLSYYVQNIASATPIELSDLVVNMRALSSLAAKISASVRARPTSVEGVKLELIVTLDDFLTNCALEDLMDMYNNIYGDNVVGGVAETGGELEDYIDEGEPVEIDSIYADD